MLIRKNELKKPILKFIQRIKKWISDVRKSNTLSIPYILCHGFVSSVIYPDAQQNFCGLSIYRKFCRCICKRRNFVSLKIATTITEIQSAGKRWKPSDQKVKSFRKLKKGIFHMMRSKFQSMHHEIFKHMNMHSE